MPMGAVLPSGAGSRMSSPQAVMTHAWQLWNLDAQRNGRDPIPLSEFGWNGSNWDQNQISRRAWDAYNTIGQEQQANFNPNIVRPISPYPGSQPPVPAPAAPAPAVPAAQTPQAPVNLLNRIMQGQTAPPAAIQPISMRPSESQAPMQQTGLMSLFNFPTLRKTKPSKGATAPGQYNENFWNAWRI
jgi:hypothetical protein